MNKKLKRKNLYVDKNKIRQAKLLLGTKTEAEAIDAALDLVSFKREFLTSLKKVAGKGVERV